MSHEQASQPDQNNDASEPEGFPITLETFNTLLDKARDAGPKTPIGRAYLDAAKAVLACATRKNCTTSDAAGRGANAIQRFVAEIRQNSWSFGALLLSNTLVLGAIVAKIAVPGGTNELRGVLIAGAVFGLILTALWAFLYHASTKMHDHTLSRVEAEDPSEAPPPLLLRRRHVLNLLIGLFALVYLIVLVLALSRVLAG